MDQLIAMLSKKTLMKASPIVVLVAGFLIAYNLMFGTVRVDFVILSEETKQPLEDVKVQFVFNGAPEPRNTNSDGYTSITIPKRDEVQVTLTKDGYKTINREINLEADPKKTVTYFMELVDPEYDLNSYFNDGDIVKETSFFDVFYKGLIDDEQDLIMSFGITSNAEEELQISKVDNFGKPRKFTSKLTERTVYKFNIDLFTNDYGSIKTAGSCTDEGKWNNRTFFFEKDPYKNWSVSELTANSTSLEETERNQIIGVFVSDDDSFNFLPKNAKIGDTFDLTSSFFGASTSGVSKDISAQGKLVSATKCGAYDCANIEFEIDLTTLDSENSSDEEGGCFDNLSQSLGIDLSNKLLSKRLAESFYYDYSPYFTLNYFKNSYLEAMDSQTKDDLFDLGQSVFGHFSQDYANVYDIEKEYVQDRILAGIVERNLGERLDSLSSNSEPEEKIENSQESTMKFRGDGKIQLNSPVFDASGTGSLEFDFDQSLSLDVIESKFDFKVSSKLVQ
jgi:hypothetical protein